MQQTAYNPPLQVQGQGHDQHNNPNSDTAMSAAAAATDGTSDAQLNGSTAMDSSATPNGGGSGMLVATGGLPPPSGGTVAISTSAASLVPPSSFSSLPGVATLSNVSGTAPGSSLAADQLKEGAVATSVSSSVATATTGSIPVSSSTTMTSGAGSTAIATVTGTLAVPVSNIGANGVLSTGGAIATSGSTASSTATSTTSSVTTQSSSSSQGLPPPAPPKAGTTTDKGGIPKATIKPNVLTHVIEGYVIQEANEPFAVQRQRYPERDSSDEPAKKRSTNESNSPLASLNAATTGGSPTMAAGADTANCEVCGKQELRNKMKRKRFCSVSCARSAKQNSTERISTPPVQNGNAAVPMVVDPPPVMNGGLTLPGPPAASVDTVGMTGPQLAMLNTAQPMVRLDMLKDSLLLQQQQQSALLTTSSVGAMATTPPVGGMLLADVSTAAGTTTPTPTGLAAAAAAAAAANAEEGSSILRWTVQDVYEFIRGLPNCADYAEEFVNQEIDGQALLLLKENHLMSTMDMKLGPALKIVARVNLMKTTIAGPDGQQPVV